MTDMINPRHYRGVTADGLELQAADIGEAFGLDHPCATAVEYVCRSGRKPGQPASVDITKAIWWLYRKLDLLAVEADGYVPSDDELAADPDSTQGRMNSYDVEEAPWSADRQDLEQAIGAVRFELLRATLRHPPIASPHEGWGILAEEFDELTAEIRRREPDRAAMRKECAQLGAMCIRLMTDVLTD